MLTLKKILVPVDFSEGSSGAVRNAAALACHFGSELILLHVVPFSASSYIGLGADFYGLLRPEIMEELTASAQERLDEIVRQAVINTGVQKVVVTGEPSVNIIEFVKTAGVDLVAMPTRGQGPFRRFLLGSVTAKVLHDVDCPVWTAVHVPEIQGDRSPSYSRIACALDLGPHSERTLRWAKAFADAYGADLAVVHAVPPGGHHHAGESVIPEWREILLESAHVAIRTLAREVECHPRMYIEAEEVTKYVPEAVRDFRADLLVIGRSVQDGGAGRLKTNAYALIRESPCPVISV